MTQSQTDCKLCFVKGKDSKDTAGPRAKAGTSRGAVVMAEGGSRAWLAAPWLLRPQDSPVCGSRNRVQRQQAEAVPVTGRKVRRGPSSGAGLAGRKVR